MACLSLIHACAFSRYGHGHGLRVRVSGANYDCVLNADGASGHVLDHASDANALPLTDKIPLTA